MKKAIIIIAVIIIAIIAIVILMMSKGPDIKQFSHLTNPAISEKAEQNMLVVESNGDPNVVGGKALKLLYKTYYTIKGVTKNFSIVAPRARWMITAETPKDQWVGLWGIPIPDTLTVLLEIKNTDSLKIYIDKWQYGAVAEILHVGPYDKEEPAIKRLTEFIPLQGYKIIGEHEEEYIKGPGMFGKGNPEKYLTIIRYRIEKADSFKTD